MPTVMPPVLPIVMPTAVPPRRASLSGFSAGASSIGRAALARSYSIGRGTFDVLELALGATCCALPMGAIVGFMLTTLGAVVCLAQFRVVVRSAEELLESEFPELLHEATYSFGIDFKALDRGIFIGLVTTLSWNGITLIHGLLVNLQRCRIRIKDEAVREHTARQDGATISAHLPKFCGSCVAGLSRFLCCDGDLDSADTESLPWFGVRPSRAPSRAKIGKERLAGALQRLMLLLGDVVHWLLVAASYAVTIAFVVLYIFAHLSREYCGHVQPMLHPLANQTQEYLAMGVGSVDTVRGHYHNLKEPMNALQSAHNQLSGSSGLDYSGIQGLASGSQGTRDHPGFRKLLLSDLIPPDPPSWLDPAAHSVPPTQGPAPGVPGPSVHIPTFSSTDEGANVPGLTDLPFDMPHGPSEYPTLEDWQRFDPEHWRGDLESLAPIANMVREIGGYLGHADDALSTVEAIANIFREVGGYFGYADDALSTAESMLQRAVDLIAKVDKVCPLMDWMPDALLRCFFAALAVLVGQMLLKVNHTKYAADFQARSRAHRRDRLREKVCASREASRRFTLRRLSEQSEQSERSECRPACRRASFEDSTIETAVRHHPWGSAAGSPNAVKAATELSAASTRTKEQAGDISGDVV